VFWKKKIKKPNEKEPEIKQYPIMQGDILCSASEFGKCIVNKCLNLGYSINTMKLEKLLVLAYGKYLCETGKKLFNEKIEICDHGVRIDEVEKDFLRYGIEFDTRFYEWYLLLDAQEKVLNTVVDIYGYMDVFEINDLPRLQKLKMYKNDKKIVPDEIIEKVFSRLY